MSDNKLDITPQTKIGELLENYPQLEAILISVASAFKKLQNPVLRQTVAKVTSIAQAARIGGIDVGQLVSRLRLEAGQDDPGEFSQAGSSSPITRRTQEPPNWLKPEKIVDRLDACRMIEAGEQPMGKVWQALERLAEREIFELITPFEPAPLINQAITKGFGVWCNQEEASLFRTSFRKVT